VEFGDVSKCLWDEFDIRRLREWEPDLRQWLDEIEELIKPDPRA
jgi:hypothetical protein